VVGERSIGGVGEDGVGRLGPREPLAVLVPATAEPIDGGDQVLDAAVTAPPQPGLLLGFGAIPTHRIEEGLRRLRRCLDG
jgi:hypothetical protein